MILVCVLLFIVDGDDLSFNSILLCTSKILWCEECPAWPDPSPSEPEAAEHVEHRGKQGFHILDLFFGEVQAWGVLATFTSSFPGGR